MFKNNKYSEKQRFSIKKYSFGVTSALVGVFLAAGANAAQAEEVNPTSASAPAATTQAAPATTQAAPATTQAAPATTQAAPATTQAAPATTQAAPATTQAAPAPTATTQAAPAPTATTQAAPKTATTMAKNTPPANSDLMINPSGLVSAWSTDGKQLREARWLSNIYEGEVIPGYEFENTFFGEAGVYQEYRKIDETTQAAPAAKSTFEGTYVGKNGEVINVTADGNVGNEKFNVLLNEENGIVNLDNPTVLSGNGMTYTNYRVYPAGVNSGNEGEDVTKQRLVKVSRTGSEVYYISETSAAPAQTAAATPNSKGVVYYGDRDNLLVTGTQIVFEDGRQVGGNVDIYPAGRELPLELNVRNRHQDDLTKDRILLTTGNSAVLYVVGSANGLRNTGIVLPGTRGVTPVNASTQTNGKFKSTSKAAKAKSTRKSGANVLPKTSATETNSALPAGLAAALLAAGLMTVKRRKN